VAVPVRGAGSAGVNLIHVEAPQLQGDLDILVI
jgi:hypothetical protein